MHQTQNSSTYFFLYLNKGYCTLVRFLSRQWESFNLWWQCLLALATWVISVFKYFIYTGNFFCCQRYKDGIDETCTKPEFPCSTYFFLHLNIGYCTLVRFFQKHPRQRESFNLWWQCLLALATSAVRPMNIIWTFFGCQWYKDRIDESCTKPEFPSYTYFFYI
jgi:hypothetical protein